MKAKIRETQWSPDGRTEVFLDDLKTMSEALSEVGIVTIDTDRWEGATIETLGEMRADPPSSILMISSAVGKRDEVSMRVDISTDHFIVWVQNDTAQLVGALNKVKDVVGPRVRRPNRWIGAGVLLGFVTCFVIGFGVKTLPALLQYSVLGVGLLILFAGLVWADGGSRSRVRIHMYPSFEHSTFMSRNREGLVVNISVALVFFLLGIGATLVLQALGVTTAAKV